MDTGRAFPAADGDALLDRLHPDPQAGDAPAAAGAVAAGLAGGSDRHDESCGGGS